MDYIVSLINSLTTNASQANWVMTIIVGLTMFTFAMGIMFLIAGIADPARRRLKSLGTNTAPKKKSASNKVVDTLEKLSPVILPKNTDESTKIRLKLIQAGFRSPNAVFLFFALKALLAVLLPVIIFLVAPIFTMITSQQVIMLAVFVMTIGVFGPNMGVSHLHKKRQDFIRKGFPDSLDLLVVCIEAGLSFDMAFRRIAEELQLPHPILAEEFSVVNGEINAGIDRTRALKNFANRTGVREIQGFVALLSQSIKLGTSIAETLRIYSEDFRDKRMQAAEEMAAKVGTKLIFPLVFCFFPSFFIVAIGPAMLKMLAAFGV